MNASEPLMKCREFVTRWQNCLFCAIGRTSIADTCLLAMCQPILRRH